MISHHPKPDLIQKFAQGDLQAPLASVVSAHIEFCSVCSRKVKSLEAELAEDFFSNSLSCQKSEKKDAWSQLASRLQSTPAQRSENTHAGVLEIEGQSFSLPRSLKSLGSSNIEWMPLVRAERSPNWLKSRTRICFLFISLLARRCQLIHMKVSSIRMLFQEASRPTVKSSRPVIFLYQTRALCMLRRRPVMMVVLF